MRNAKVTPKGIPPLTNPMNKGTELQEQNGVSAPKEISNFFYWEIGVYDTHHIYDKEK